MSLAGDVAAGLAGRQVDVLPQPGKRDPHQISIPNGAGEPDVTLDHVAHVLDVVAEHQRPLDAHAEREAAVASPGRRRRRRSTRGLTMPQPPTRSSPRSGRCGRAGPGCRRTRRGRRSTACPSRRTAR